jgi:hypothetical protein
MSSPLVPATSSRPAPGQWEVAARGGIGLRFDWVPFDEGRRVRVAVHQLAGPGSGAVEEATLGLGPDEPKEAVLAFGLAPEVIDVTLTFGHHGDRASEPEASPLEAAAEAAEAPRAWPHGHRDHDVRLWVNLPLSPSVFLDRAITEWRAGPHDHPVDPVDPVDPPDPFDPADGDDRVAVVEPLPGATDLFPFLWLATPTPAEQLDAATRFTSPLDPATLPLYVTLAAETGTGAAGAAAKVADATAFRSSQLTLFTGLAAWPAPIPDLPAVRIELLALRGARTLDVLTREADDLLAPYGSSVDQLLAPGQTGDTPEGQAWEVLFALALAGTPADGALAADLVDVLRVYHYLRALQAGDVRLARAGVRRLALDATPALPDACAAYPLAGAVTAPTSAPAPAPAPAVSGQWSLLGVGELAIARQRLRGYVPGELAEVVNLMPRERQERHERQRTSTERRTESHEDHRRVDDRVQLSDAAAELADTLREAMAAGGVMRNLQNVTPAYENLNLMLTGSGSDADATARWNADRVARVLQRASERAAQEVADRTGGQRREVWRDWREQRASQCIDNREGGRMVGVYRWVDRLLHIGMHRQGRRLVLSLRIDSPAAAWTARVLSRGPLPQAAPQPLPAFSVPDGQGYAQVTPSNYQSWGARYGLEDLPPPPADLVAVTAQVTRVAIADTTLLRVPDGYQVRSGTVSVALADSLCSLAAGIGPVTLPVTAAVPPAALAPTVANVSSATDFGPPTIQPPTATPALIVATPIDVDTAATKALVGARGALPVTVMSDAPLFGVGIELLCERVTLPADGGDGGGGAAVVDPLLVDWQVRVYARLLAAYRAAAAAYAASSAARLAAASEGRTEEVQRETLRAACLALLAASSATSDPSSLDGLLDWAGMSWRYEAPAGAAGAGDAAAALRPASANATASARVFARFLDAAEAGVLLPVLPATQSALLFALQWQPRWPMAAWPPRGVVADIPVAQSVVLALEEQRQREREPADDGPRWTLRLPLPLLYLQRGDALPRFTEPLPRVPQGRVPEDRAPEDRMPDEELP